MFDPGDDETAMVSSGCSGACATRGGSGTVAATPREERPEPWRRLSHELGTPFHAILGHAELLLDGSFGPLGSEVKSCIAEIQGAGRQLAVEFRRLLLIVEAAGAPQRRQELVEMESLFRHAFARRGIDRLAWQGPPMMVTGERFWLRVMAEAAADLLAGERRDQAPLVHAPQHDARRLEIGAPWLAEQQTDPVPLALIQVVAARHGAEAVWLSAGGLQLKDLPTA